MTVNTRADIDLQARAIARDVCAGVRSDHDGRVELADLMFRSGVAAEVASSAGRVSLQTRLDVAETVGGKLAEWIMDSTSTFFDIETLQSASLCGWARHAGRQVAQWSAVRRPRGLAAVLTFVDPLAGGHDSDGAVTALDVATEGYHSSPSMGGASSEDMVLSPFDNEDLPFTEEVRTLASWQRTESRPATVSATLRRVLGLPALCVPFNDGDRQYALDRCLEDPLLAQRSWRATIDTLEGSRRRSSIDERLLSLWDDFSLPNLHALDNYPPSALHFIVVGALTPAPKLSRLAARTMARTVRDAHEGRSRAWSSLSHKVVASYLARKTHAVSEFDDTSDEEAKEAKRQAAAVDAAAWPALVREVIEHPGAPLGTDAMAVEEALAHALAAAWNADADDRISRSAAKAA